MEHGVVVPEQKVHRAMGGAGIASGAYFDGLDAMSREEIKGGLQLQ
jgi:hypothetical protein